MRLNKITQEQKKAFEIRNACPLPIKKFIQLCSFVAESDTWASSDLFATLEFVAKHKLSKKNTLKWLDNYNIGSDVELVRTVWLPIVQRCADMLEAASR